MQSSSNPSQIQIHINTFELGQHGRTRTNVWTYPGVNTFRTGRMDELRMHPTVKPVSLIADAMRDCSRRGAIVLDAFAGSGSTIIAAEQVGRRAFCIEIDPRYVDTCIRRWQRMTGKDAILETTGQTFDELAEMKSPSQRLTPCLMETLNADKSIPAAQRLRSGVRKASAINAVEARPKRQSERVPKRFEISGLYL